MGPGRVVADRPRRPKQQFSPLSNSAHRHRARNNTATDVALVDVYNLDANSPATAPATADYGCICVPRRRYKETVERWRAHLKLDSFRPGSYDNAMITQLPRVGSILLVSGLMVASASAQNSSIQGFVRNIDGKRAAGAEVKVERVDAKARSITINADAKGNYAVAGLPGGTFKVTAYGKEIAKEVGGINTKNATSVTVNVDLAAKPSGKQETYYVWVKGDLGSMIGGKWVELNEAKSLGMNSILKVNRAGARETFDDAHRSYNLTPQTVVPPPAAAARPPLQRVAATTPL